MITIPNIIADIKSELKSYSEAGLIDEISLELHLINELKRFGGNVMDVYPLLLEVKNSQTQLPKNFFSLYKALRVYPVGYSCEEENTIEELNFGSTFFRVRKEASTTWNNLSNRFIPGEYTEVTEKVYIQNRNVNVHYGHQTHLELVQGFDKSKIDPKCENLRIKQSPYKISIINNTLQTNFPTGFIYIWYQGLRETEDGRDIVLPEDPNARLYQFLFYSGQAKVFEMLWKNDDEPNAVTKLQYLKEETRKARIEASSQATMSSVTGTNWIKGIKEKQRRRTAIYEI
jgi:hypothetical protein